MITLTKNNNNKTNKNTTTITTTTTKTTFLGCDSIELDLVFLKFLVAVLTSNIAVLVHILHNHFRDVGGQDHDYLDYAWCLE